MKKTILFLLLCTNLVVSGCSSNTESEESKKDDKQTKSVDLTADEYTPVDTMASQPTEDNFAEYLSKRLTEGTHTAMITKVGFENSDDQDRFNELIGKLTTSVNQNQDYFIEYSAQYPNQPLPYTDKLGVTEKEYEEFLALREKQKLVKVDDMKIKVATTGEGLSIISDTPEIFGEMTIDFADKEMTVDSATVPYNRILQASDSQTATGKWSGYIWKSDTVDVLDEVGIGQVEETGKTIIYIQKAARAVIVD